MRDKSKRILLKISIVFGSIIFALLVSELALRIFYSFKYHPKAKTKLPISQTYQISKDKNLLYELKPNSSAKINQIEFKINRFGFRDKNYSLIKSTPRIICVGDSITYGWNVDLNQTFHKQLEKKLKFMGHPVDVMGMGVVGYNIFQEFHLIKKKALQFKPDMIILQICPNDFQRRLGIKLFRNTKKFVLIPYHDVAIPYVFKKSGLTTFFMNHSHLFKFLNRKLFQLIKKSNKDYSPQDSFFLAEKESFDYMIKIKKLLKQKGIAFYAVLFPYRKIENTYRFSNLRERLRNHLKKNHVPFVDLYEEFNVHTKENIWIDRIHPNSTGHEMVTQKLLPLILPDLQQKIKKE